MAERKSALKRAPERPELEKLFKEARSVKLTDEDIQAQRESFVFGNAPKDSGITKKSAQKAAARIRVTAG